jgi:hypothetical protein
MKEQIRNSNFQIEHWKLDFFGFRIQNYLVKMIKENVHFYQVCDIFLLSLKEEKKKN